MNIEKLQKIEERIASFQVALAVGSPLTVTLLVESHLQPLAFAAPLGAVLALLIWMQNYRSQIKQEIKSYYENLHAGVVLRKKLHSLNQEQFVVTQASFQHYHLRGLKTERQILIPRRRIYEDFAIAPAPRETARHEEVR